MAYSSVKEEPEARMSTKANFRKLISSGLVVATTTLFVFLILSILETSSSSSTGAGCPGVVVVALVSKLKKFDLLSLIKKSRLEYESENSYIRSEYIKATSSSFGYLSFICHA